MPSRRSRRRPGRRGSPTGGRTARGSSGCARRPTSPSTRRAAAPGVPLSILSSFSRRLRRGGGDAGDDAEALADRASTTAMGVLTLAGVERGDARPRAHVPLGAARRRAGRRAATSTSPPLIQGVQSPPFEKIGVLDVDAFYPSKERFALATKLNAVLASPGIRAVARGGAARRRAPALRRRRGSRASRSCRSRTWTTRTGCSSCRCC